MKKLMALITVVLFASVNTWAQEARIVVSPMAGYVNADQGIPEGPIVDIMNALMLRTSYAFTVNDYPWARAFQQITQGEPNTLMPHLLRNADRENMVRWVVEIMPMEFWMVRKRLHQDVEVTSLDDARQYQFASVIGDATTQYLLDHDFPNVWQVSRNDQLINMLERGRVDLIVQDKAALFREIDQQGLKREDYELVYKLDDISSMLWLTASPGTDDRLVHELREALISIVSDGTYEQILEKWSFTGD